MDTGDGGGAEGNRTPDLLIANEALSQLSYSPIPRIGSRYPGRRRARTMLIGVGEVNHAWRPGAIARRPAGPTPQPISSRTAGQVAYRKDRR